MKMAEERAMTKERLKLNLKDADEIYSQISAERRRLMREMEREKTQEEEIRTFSVSHRSPDGMPRSAGSGQDKFISILEKSRKASEERIREIKRQIYEVETREIEMQHTFDALHGLSGKDYDVLNEVYVNGKGVKYLWNGCSNGSACRRIQKALSHMLNIYRSMFPDG
jgi:DNA repair exonuclease SbcCD ATPase subunit